MLDVVDFQMEDLEKVPKNEIEIFHVLDNWKQFLLVDCEESGRKIEELEAFLKR